MGRTVESEVTTGIKNTPAVTATITLQPTSTVLSVRLDDLHEKFAEADIPEEMKDLVDRIVKSFAFIGG